MSALATSYTPTGAIYKNINQGKSTYTEYRAIKGIFFWLWNSGDKLCFDSGDYIVSGTIDPTI